jgi:phosphotransferase system HPr (HPr) family protein
MFVRTVTIRNKTGLHVRPAGLFVETASKFRSAVQVATADQEADGRSVLGLMLLELTPGSEITIRAEGEDEAEAAGELAALVERGFSE